MDNSLKKEDYGILLYLQRLKHTNNPALLNKYTYQHTIISIEQFQSFISLLKQDIIYLNKIKLMGTTCCADNYDQRKNLQDIEDRFTRISHNNQFYQTLVPDDQFIQQKINEIKQKEIYALVSQSHKVMKHKFLDKYYIGKWNSGGEPEGLGIMFEPENYIYHGQFKVLPHGIGKLELFKEKIIYEGQIKQGKANGKGKMTSQDHRFQFQGIMQNSFPKSGVIKINNLADPSKSYSIEIDNFPDQPVKITYEDGRIYEGQIDKRSFAPSGQGTAYFPDTSKYQGQWDEGQMHGHGVFYWKDGTSYVGQYQHGRKHGIGTFNYVSKKQYQGHWVGGKQNGKGKLCDENGKVLKEGIWKEGVFERQQTL